MQLVPGTRTDTRETICAYVADCGSTSTTANRSGRRRSGSNSATYACFSGGACVAKRGEA